MTLIRDVRSFAAQLRWPVLLTARRVANRWWDAVGYAAGFCMRTTWQDGRATYRPGYKHWRCWVLRKDHAGRLHRTGDYRWPTGGQPIYDPPPFNLMRRGIAPGSAPRWLSGRHYDVGTRRRDRLERLELRAAFERARASGLARAERARAERAASVGELGIVPFTRRPDDDGPGQ